ncbi:hypothetical protein BVRB_2g031630 [Beta vulgaris subsp. vulgaris]|uniref:Uncharacterized protein n=1 Tax=Beta vulgaris subsp. vulgaris TaxID=3555 RepID=A0A0J8D1F2_BETVV|nr:hypothetical protein BVRB_2g031630 [Beta vulgaris subsp. vulgaris]
MLYVLYHHLIHTSQFLLHAIICQLTVVCCVLPLLLCAVATADCCMFAAVVAGLFVLLDQEMHNEELLPDLSGE